MNIIVAVDQNWGIGCGGRLLASIPEDMRFFRQMTTGKVVIMGHTTLKSLPGGKPLANRVNIVLSKDATLKIAGAAVCHSVGELLSAVAQYNAEDVFVIGGEAVYTLLLPYCKTAYVTKIHAAFEADRHFPDIDKPANWRITDRSEMKFHSGTPFQFLTYTNFMQDFS